MEQGYLIDSNAVIDYLSGIIPEKGMGFMHVIIDQGPVISVITKIEVLGYQTTSAADKLLKNFVNDSLVLDLRDEVVNKTISIRKQSKIKTPDAIIAATAIVNKLTVITRNTRDFIPIKGLKVLNPYDI